MSISAAVNEERFILITGLTPCVSVMGQASDIVIAGNIKLYLEPELLSYTS